MTKSALSYPPPSKWPIVTAFATAIMIHLYAVALASHRVSQAVEPPASIGGEITAIEEPDPAPATPEIATPLLAPAPFEAEFVEGKQQPPILRTRVPKPLRQVAMARSVGMTNGRALASHAPRPEYPYEARSRHITGSGVVALTVNEESGSVVRAEMEQSIGNSILDQAALSALRRWRFKTGTPGRVRVPITFTIAGAQF